jgi:hypothetical protein
MSTKSNKSSTNTNEAIFKGEKYVKPCREYAAGRCDEHNCLKGFKHVNFCIYCANNECKKESCNVPKAVHVERQFWKVGNIGIIFESKKQLDDKNISTKKQTTATVNKETFASKVANGLANGLTNKPIDMKIINLCLTDSNEDETVKVMKEYSKYADELISRCTQNMSDVKVAKAEIDNLRKVKSNMATTIEMMYELHDAFRDVINELDDLVRDKEKLQSRAMTVKMFPNKKET